MGTQEAISRIIRLVGGQDGLRIEVQALTQSLTSEHRRTEGKRRLFIAVGAALMALCVFGLWRLTSMAFKLDAEALRLRRPVTRALAAEVLRDDDGATAGR